MIPSKVGRLGGRALDLVIAALLAVIAGVVCANVFSRYALGTSLFGSADFTLLVLLWMTFIAAVGVESEVRHFSMPLLREGLPGRYRERLNVWADAVSCCALAVLAGSSLTLVSVYSASTQISLGIPKALYAYPVVIGSFVMLAVVLVRLGRRIFARRRHPAMTASRT